ncbi:MAG: AMP-binding protein [Nitriliruptoraceae bacterium]
MPDSHTFSSTDVWHAAAARLDHDPSVRLNTFHEACGRWASDRGRLALTVVDAADGREQWSYYELAHAAAKASGMFARLGLTRGERIASVMTRQSESWITALAAWRAGMVYVPLYAGFGAGAMAMRINESRTKLVVVDAAYRDVLEEALNEIRQDLIIVTVGGEKGRGIRRGDVSFWADLDTALPVDEAHTTKDDIATLMFTSGTTSAPKSCMMTHAAFLALTPFVQYAFGLDTNDLLFATSDPSWSYGLYTSGAAPMSLGIPRLMYRGDFDAYKWLEVIADEHVTATAGAPTAFRRVLDATKRTGWPASFRTAATAGEPLDTDTVEAWKSRSGFDIRDAYGLSEVGMVLCNLMRPTERAVKPGWLSSAVPGFDVELRTLEGKRAAVGEEGVLAIRRPPFALTRGYENAPEAWEGRFVDDWYITDDLFVADEEGYFQFRGRADDVIVTSGINVGPVEVETILMEHAGVDEAAVVASPDPGRGSVVRAVLVKTANAPAEDVLCEELKQAVAAAVGRHAAPRIFEFVDSLPRTETGKVRRAELRQTSAGQDN